METLVKSTFMFNCFRKSIVNNVVILLKCSLIIAFISVLAFPLKAFNTIEIAQEAENGYSYSGPGTPTIKSRVFASNQKTLWVNEVGAETFWDITIPAAGDYSLLVRYSNDDTGALDDISVRVNGNLVGNFESQDTGSGGNGWNVFVESPVISLGQLVAGTITLSLSLDADDGYGIEFDLLSLTGTNIQAPSAPLLASPTNGASDIISDFSLEWNPSPGLNSYRIQVDDESDFSSPEVDTSGLMNTEFQVNGLDEGTTYFWRVRASNTCENGPWSMQWMFSTECLVFADITINGSADFCNGESIELTASGGIDYLWSNGETTPSITVSTSGVYMVTVSNSVNCVASDAVNVTASTANGPYYHPLQNFDFYVDEVKKFYNFFGGNSGVVNDVEFELAYDTSETRTNYGRSLKITYEDLDNYSIYVESFERSWFDTSTSFNLKNLFPDFTNAALQNRQIDSIVFFCKLTLDSEPLTLQVKLEDANGGAGTINQLIQPDTQWQRFAFALDDFIGNFDPTIAKLVGLNFDQGLGQNNSSSGVFYLDDIYLVENCFQKPVFSSPEDMMAYLNEISFRYFWMATEPDSKFALDRHVWKDLVSTDAIGFSLSAYVIAHKNGWIDPQLLEGRVEHILTYLLDSCSHATNVDSVINNPLGYVSINGIWAHFLDDKTLARKDDETEFSIFSTALLLAGVITAAEYFDSNPTIVAKADSLYRMTNWNFLLRPDGLMNYDWKPETGFSPFYTDWFSEELDLAFLLGISSPEPANNLAFNPYLLEGYRKPLCLDGNYVYSAPGANFTYYFLQMYARFDEQTQRFQNSRNALLNDIAFCQNEYETLDYNSLIFGTTACEGPDSAAMVIIGTDTSFISNYHAYGYCCKFDQHNTGNGTVACYGSGSAALFLPQEVKDLWSYFYNDLDESFWDEYAYGFWSPIFGMPDAFHLATDSTWDTLVNNLGFRGPWLSTPRFGIDVGPMIMNIDSYLAEAVGNPSVRDYFSSNSLIAGNLSQFDSLVPTDELMSAVAISLLSDETVCEGEQQNFAASWEDGGDAPLFEWYLDGVLEQSGVDTLFSITAIPGIHSIFCKMTSDEDCIEGQVAMSDILTAYVLPVDTMTVTLMASANEICEGQSVIFEAVLTNGGNSPVFEWFVNGIATGNTEQVFETSDLIVGEHSITCKITSLEECVAEPTIMSAPIIVQVFPLPMIDTLFSNTPICAGDTLEISVFSDGLSYEWIAPTGNVYTLQTVLIPNASVWDSGIWNLSISSFESCATMVELEIIVDSLPIVSIDSSCLPDSILASALPFPLASCGIPSGGIFTVNGEVTNTISEQLMVGSLEIVYSYTDTNSCTGSASILIDIISGNKTIWGEDFQFTIFPNPSNGLFIVSIEGIKGPLQVSLFDPLGREIEKQNVSSSELDKTVLDFQYLPSGIYFFLIEQGGKYLITKVAIVN
ncbi:MAG: T9SS type A sorting domain-containing protein [Saprospiraceae bacterium]|nr:T9SS type A sorting domain-containing protein [Saprospiraceae bacterium]